MAGCRVGGHIWLIFGLFLIGFDFYSDIRVTVGLYNSCHYIFMKISILILTLPSAFMLIFLLANLIFNCKDSLSTHVKQKSGLYPNYLFGFVFCRPLTQVIIAIIETFNKEKFGRQAREGLQTLELFAQSELQLIFTCYIRANLGPGQAGLFTDDERFESIAISFFRIVLTRSIILSTRLGQEELECSRIPKYFWITLIDNALVSSTIIVFNILFGIRTTSIVGSVVLVLEIFFQFAFFQRGFFRTLEETIFSIFGPMVGIIRELRKGANKGLVIFVNRIFLYTILASLLLASTLSLIYGNPYYDFDHMEESVEKDCENICGISDGTAQNDICQKMMISTSDVLIWLYVNWGLFGLSLTHAVGIFLCRKKFQPVVISPIQLNYI